MPSYLLKKSTGELETITGSLPLTTTPQAGPGAYEIYALSTVSASVQVGYTPPSLVGSLGDLTYEAGIGTIQIATDGAFSGYDLTFALAQPVPEVSLDGTTGVVTIETTTPGVRQVEVEASNPAGTVSTSFTVTIEAASGTAPSFVTAPSLTPSAGPIGTVFALDEGVVTGGPSPTVSVSLTENGVDVTSQISGMMTYTSTTEGPLELVVTATNGIAPDAQALASALVTDPNAQAAPQLAAYPEFRSPATPLGQTLVLDPGAWWGGDGPIAPTLTVEAAGVDVTASLVARGDGAFDLTLPEAGAVIAKVEASNPAGSTTLYVHSQILPSDTELSFGALTPVGQGALDSSTLAGGAIPDGTYGPFTVTGGIMTPNTSPLTPGEINVDGRTVTVVGNAISCASLTEIAAAYARPSADLPAAGGKAGLQIRLRKGPSEWISPGNDYNDRFVGHDGMPCQITSEDMANRTVLGKFNIGAPNQSDTGLRWGHVGVLGVDFFEHTTTRTEQHGQNFINIYDQYNAWNFVPTNIMELNSGGGWVEHVFIGDCAFRSDLPDLSQYPIADLPAIERGGLRFGLSRFCIAQEILFENIFNGISLGGEDNAFRRNTQRFCHGDMIRMGGMGSLGPSRRLVIEGNRWHSATGDNFRHPDFFHAFSTAAPGVEDAVIRGNLALCDETTLRQPSKATGQRGTLLWQAPQFASTTLPAQNAAYWLFRDTAPITVTAPAIADLPVGLMISGFYAAGSDRLVLTKTDADWQVGDTFDHNGTIHTITAINTVSGRPDVIANYGVSPALQTGVAGSATITAPTMADGASLASSAPLDATTLSVTLPYGQLRVGDTFQFIDSPLEASYRIDGISGSGATRTLTITPGLKKPGSAGDALTFTQFWSVARAGAQGAGITITPQAGEDFDLDSQSLETSLNLSGAWSEYHFRVDFMNRRWKVLTEGKTAYQTMFANDPADGWQNIRFETNLTLCPGKGVDFGGSFRAGTQGLEVAANIFALPWPGDLDGDGVPNTRFDGKQATPSGGTIRLGSSSAANSQTMRIAGNIAGSAQVVGPGGAGVDFIPLNHIIAADAVDNNDFSGTQGIFQGAAGGVFLPTITSLVNDLRPEIGGDTDQTGDGMLGSATDGQEDLWNFETCRLRSQTPWEVLHLEAVANLDEIEVTWFEPAFRHRDSLFGPPLPILGYGCAFSLDGGGTWTDGTALIEARLVDGQTIPAGRAVLTGFAPGDNVQIRVRARNQRGWGRWSTITRPVPALGLPALAQSTTLQTPQKTVPNRAVLIALAYDSAGAASRVDQIVINGQVFATDVARSVAARGVALLVLREAELAGLSGDLTIVPQWSGQPAAAYDLGAVTLSGIHQTAALSTEVDDPNLAQSLSITAPEAGGLYGICVSNTAPVVTTGGAQELWRTDAVGGHSVLSRVTGTGTLGLATETPLTWGILAAVRLRDA